LGVIRSQGSTLSGRHPFLFLPGAVGLAE
jgi:hypothetical protein